MRRRDSRPASQRASDDPVARYLGQLQAEVMDVFWESGAATVRDVLVTLNERRKKPFAYTTILTLVRRLYGRGLLAREQEGRGFRYRAEGSRDEFLGELSDKLIDQLFSDFGAVGIARLTERLETVGEPELKRLRDVAKKR